MADGEARDDTHAALAAALHVPPEEVKPADEDNLAANKAFERGETVLLKDMVAEHTRTGAPFIGNPSWAGEAIPSKPPKDFNTISPEQIAVHDEPKTEDPRPFPVGDKKPGWMSDLLQKASAEQEPNGSEQQPQAAPVHPFADRAKISQSIKTAIAQATSGFPDVEVEGLQILAQLVSQIVTSEPDKAREIWMHLGKHCDDVAAALR